MKLKGFNAALNWQPVPSFKQITGQTESAGVVEVPKQWVVKDGLGKAQGQTPQGKHAPCPKEG